MARKRYAVSYHGSNGALQIVGTRFVRAPSKKWVLANWSKITGTDKYTIDNINEIKKEETSDGRS